VTKSDLPALIVTVTGREESSEKKKLALLTFYQHVVDITSSLLHNKFFFKRSFFLSFFTKTNTGFGDHCSFETLKTHASSAKNA
jgi:hypothetical protein